MSIYKLIQEAEAGGKPFAVATVVETFGSSSAKTGAKAVVDSDGIVIAGWVGGGCAESAVRQTAMECMASGETTVMDIDLNDEVLGAGMPCGGGMRVYVEPVMPEPKLWILGHGRIAECICIFGSMTGFQVIVDDPGADAKMYPWAGSVITDDKDYSLFRPATGDFVVVATQHKGDHISMKLALKSEVARIALVASSKRAALILDYLKEEGFGTEELKRISAPAGVDIGARTPEEIALSIISEIVMVRRGGTGNLKKAQ